MGLFMKKNEGIELCQECAERIDKSMTNQTEEDCAARLLGHKARPKKVGFNRGKAGTQYDCPYYNTDNIF